MRYFGILGVAMMAFAAPAAAFEVNPEGALARAAIVGRVIAAPDTVIDLEDGRTSLPEYSGQVALVTLWATWCDVCKHEMPKLAALGEEYRGRDLSILPVSVDEAPAMEKIVMYMTSHGLALPVMHDRNFALTARVGLRGTPTTIVVDKFSQVVAAFEGQAPWDDAETRAWLDALIAAETPEASRNLLGG